MKLYLPQEFEELRTHARTHAHARTHTHSRTHTHVHTHMYIHTRTHTHAHTHTHTHTHTHVHTHTHKHTHVHTHTHTHRDLLGVCKFSRAPFRPALVPFPPCFLLPLLYPFFFLFRLFALSHSGLSPHLDFQSFEFCAASEETWKVALFADEWAGHTIALAERGWPPRLFAVDSHYQHRRKLGKTKSSV